MRRGYVRPDKRMGETVQLAALESFKCSVIYTEARPPIGNSLTERADAIASLRDSNELCVSHLHRLGVGKNDLQEAVKAVIGKRAVIVECSTGRMSDDPASLVDMMGDANAFYRKAITPERATEIGKLGASMSPVAQRRRDRMPIKDGLKIINDRKRYPKLVDALKAINKVRGYKRPWNVAYVYRLKADGYPVKGRNAKNWKR